MKRKNSRRRDLGGRKKGDRKKPEGGINSTALISRGKQANLIFAFKWNPVQATEQTLTFHRKRGSCSRQGRSPQCAQGQV